MTPARAGAAATSVISVACDALGSGAAAKPLEQLKFHGIWLRDNCLCPRCLEVGTLQRQVLRSCSVPQCFACLHVIPWPLQVDTSALPLHITPMDVSVGRDGAELKVVWPGDPPHVSLYPVKWLKDHAYWTADNKAPVAATEDVAMSKATRRVFDSATFVGDDGALRLPQFTYEDVLSSDEALYGVLKCVRRAPVCRCTARYALLHVGADPRRRLCHCNQYPVRNRIHREAVQVRIVVLPRCASLMMGLSCCAGGSPSSGPLFTAWACGQH